MAKKLTKAERIRVNVEAATFPEKKNRAADVLNTADADHKKNPSPRTKYELDMAQLAFDAVLERQSFLEFHTGLSFSNLSEDSVSTK